MSDQRASYQRVLSRYIPEAFIPYVTDLLLRFPVKFKIVKPRKTKLGDFRMSRNGEKPQITVNGDLNPYSFLVTTIHEFAHLVTFQEHGPGVAPHGKEWKATYSELLAPVIESGELPETLENALRKSVRKVKASSCTDQQLHRVLLTFNSHQDDLQTLESLEKNSIFALNGRTFQKGELRRTRFLCTEVKTRRTYLVNALAHVQALENEQ